MKTNDEPQSDDEDSQSPKKYSQGESTFLGPTPSDLRGGETPTLTTSKKTEKQEKKPFDPLSGKNIRWVYGHLMTERLN